MFSIITWKLRTQNMKSSILDIHTLHYTTTHSLDKQRLSRGSCNKSAIPNTKLFCVNFNLSNNK